MTQQDVAQLLIKQLQSEKLVPGARVPAERELAATLNLPRGSVRQVLKALELLGVIESRVGDGTYLSHSPAALLTQTIEWGLLLGDRNLDDLIETRSVIEIACAGFAAQRRSSTDLELMQREISIMQSSDADLESYIAADVRFHSAVATASNNRVLSDMHRSIVELLRVWTAQVIHAAGDTKRSLAVHTPILAAIEKEDATLAQSAMVHHMECATANLYRILQSRRRT